jgi:ParB-like chromosome segregation protein Spo0J
MSKPLPSGFDLEPVRVPLDKLLPTRRLPATIKSSVIYQQIAASIAEVGIIEPLVVFPAPGAKGSYLLLEGHVRLFVLKERGDRDVLCIVARDDEAYTYNRQVNHLTPIQRQRMLAKAVRAGVSEERIAKTLNISIDMIRTHLNILADICPEAADLLKDKPVAEAAFRPLKKVKALRQIEIAELMIAANNYSLSYCKALVEMTAPDKRVDAPRAASDKPKPEDLARLETEVETLQKKYLLIDDTYGRDMLHLTCVRAYLKKLLDNSKVVRFLAQKHPEYLAEFQRIVEATLEGAA